MVRLVSEAGTVVEVSAELASRLPGFNPVEKKKPEPKRAPAKRAPARKKSE